MPQKEQQMFHETMLSSEEDFATAFRDIPANTAERKKIITQLRSTLREELKEKDFKGIVSKL